MAGWRMLRRGFSGFSSSWPSSAVLSAAAAAVSGVVSSALPLPFFFLEGFSAAAFLALGFFSLVFFSFTEFFQLTFALCCSLYIS